MPLSATYRTSLRALLTSAERRVFARLSTPEKIQDFLDRMPVNFEESGDTHMSPRRVLRERRAHCTEGAMLAAACFAYHGRPPLLMDLRSLPADQDHVVAPFQVRGLWGAISKTNHAVLRWRDPVYRSPRELAMSYAHEYYLPSGRKSLMSFSRPFRLSRYAARRWVTAEDELDWLIAALDDAPHEAVAPRAALALRRRVSPLERHTVEIVEWRPPDGSGRPPAWKPRIPPR
ncbi:MAG: hypothetical protein AB7O50_04770 [Pseudolabrys sp.]